MRHCFLMQVHRDPELFESILLALSAPNHYFIINIDRKSPMREKLERVASKFSNIISISEQNIMHGGFSMINCTINQLGIALENDMDYIHTMSGQDYPCVSNETLDYFFELNEGKSFMIIDSEDQAANWRNTKYRRRLEMWNYIDVFSGTISRKLQLFRVANKVMSTFKRPYYNIESVWGGWNWFSLSNSVVKYLMQYIKENPDFIKRFHYTNCADELFYPTILYPVRNQLNIDITNSLRYIEWHDGSTTLTHPKILTELDYSEILQSGAMFCRKVETIKSKELISLLDERISKMGIVEELEQNPKHP